MRAPNNQRVASQAILNNNIFYLIIGKQKQNIGLFLLQLSSEFATPSISEKQYVVQRAIFIPTATVVESHTDTPMLPRIGSSITS